MTLLNLFFLLPNVLLQKKYYIRRKKEDKEGNLRIDCDISSHSEGFFSD